MPDRRFAARVLAELWQALRGHQRRAAAALALLIGAKLLGVAVPLLLKAIIDRLGAPPPAAAADAGGAWLAAGLLLPALLIGYALLRFGSTLFTELRDLVFAPVAQQVVIGFSQRCFAKLLGQGARFHSGRETGALVREVERGTTGVGFLLGAGLFTIVPTLVEFVAVLAVLALGYDWDFAAIVLVTFFVYAAYTTQMTARRMLRQRQVNEMDSRAHGRLVDTLLNYDNVKAFAREQHEINRYQELCRAWIASALGNQRALSALHIGQGAVIAAGVAAVMLLAGDRTLHGRMTVGDLVLVNAYVIQICLPLNALGFVFREARDALVNLESAFRLLDRAPEIGDAPDAAPYRPQGGAVRFEHVDFAYDSGRRVLLDVDLALAPGQTVAVVGGSGSGKSTLARLLMRLYDPDGGRVSIDGQDLRTLQLASLRHAVGIVPQDTVLFNASIAYNIGYGRLDATMDEIVAAAQAAHVHEFVLSLPQQYETVVGERGTRLSGGERQRLAIARALLKNPPIIVFDEATAALDTRAERAIQAELDRTAAGRTALVIAHRLSTVVNADLIVVMDKGRIIERGRHDELLAHQGLYAQMWNLQRQQQQVERLERALVREPVNLVPLVVDAADALRLAIEARHVQLDADIDVAYARVNGDRATLARLPVELLSTALRATPAGGRVRIALSVPGTQPTHARLTVSDGLLAGQEPPPDGEGLEAAARLEPLDPMALRSIVERQGGRLGIEPRSTTAGTRYQVELPLQPSGAG